MAHMKLLSLLLALTLSPALVASVVTMGFGEFPPFVFPDGKSGIEIEITQAALAHTGHKLVPIVLPMARLPTAYLGQKIDSIMSDVGNKNLVQDGYYGDVSVIYQNVFITLKKRKILIKTPKDLDGLTVIGYIGAGTRYPLWLDKVISTGSYIEKNQQELQILQLLQGRVDVVLSDRDIFKYYYIQTKKNTKAVFSDFVFHPVLKEDPLDFRPVFRSKQVRDDFNSGLRHIKRSGGYQAIFNKYLQE